MNYYSLKTVQVKIRTKFSKSVHWVGVHRCPSTYSSQELLGQSLPNLVRKETRKCIY